MPRCQVCAYGLNDRTCASGDEWLHPTSAQARPWWTQERADNKTHLYCNPRPNCPSSTHVTRSLTGNSGYLYSRRLRRCCNCCCNLLTFRRSWPRCTCDRWQLRRSIGTYQQSVLVHFLSRSLLGGLPAPAERSTH